MEFSDLQSGDIFRLSSTTSSAALAGRPVACEMELLKLAPGQIPNTLRLNDFHLVTISQQEDVIKIESMERNPKLTKVEESFTKTFELKPFQFKALKSLTQQAVKAQEEEHNGKGFDATPYCEEVENYAKSIGLSVDWRTGLHPLFGRENQGFDLWAHLPD